MRCFVVLCLLLSPVSASFSQAIPPTETKSLNGNTVMLPRDLTTPTVLLIGFSRKSADATTQWQKQLHAAAIPHLRVLDLAMLAAVPSPLRGFVTRAIRKDVPEAYRSDLLIITTNEAAWKSAAHFDPNMPDAPYLLLLNAHGDAVYHSHAAFSATALADLRSRVLQLH